MLYQVLIVVYLIVALCLIGLVLIQQGKGADMGASFGAGSSATIFGSSGSGNFLTKTTTYLAIAFFVISLILGNLTANLVKSGADFDNLSVPAGQVAPATDAIPTESLEPKVDNADVPSSDTPVEKDSDVPN